MRANLCAWLFEKFAVGRVHIIENGQVVGMVGYNYIVIYGMVRR